jgi:hypothetical protein
MLNDAQIRRVWENMLAAEARSYYFGDLASRYATQKQWITGASFFLASGAAATIIAKAPDWVPIVFSLVAAAASAYSMAVSLDAKIITMAKLHSRWSRILNEYERLWSTTYADDAQDQLDRITQLEEEPSELATTEAPNDQKLMEKWQDRVFALRGLATDRHATSN